MKDLAREHVIALDKAHVWHPYTAMDEYIAETNPLVVSRASGCRAAMSWSSLLHS